MGKINIGKISVMKGEYIPGNSYDRLWQVTYCGSTYQSRIDGNTSAPAQLSNGIVSHINTDKWLCIADGSPAWNTSATLDKNIETKVSAMSIDANGHLWVGIN